MNFDKIPWWSCHTDQRGIFCSAFYSSDLFSLCRNGMYNKRYKQCNKRRISKVCIPSICMGKRSLIFALSIHPKNEKISLKTTWFSQKQIKSPKTYKLCNWEIMFDFLKKTSIYAAFGIVNFALFVIFLFFFIKYGMWHVAMLNCTLASALKPIFCKNTEMLYNLILTSSLQS